MLLAAVLVVGCGIPQEDYASVITERDAAQDEAKSLQSNLNITKTDLNVAEKELTTTKSELTTVQDELLVVKKDVATAQTQIEILEGDATTAQTQIETLEGNITTAQTQIDTMEGDLAATEEQLGLMEAVLEAVYGELLFYDGFEDGDTEGWDFRGFKASWSVIQEDNNYLLHNYPLQGGEIETIRNASIISSYDWISYTLEFRINITQVESAIGFWVNFRANQDLSKSYMLGISPTIAWIQKGDPVLTEKRWSDPLRGWIDIKIEVYRDNVRVYINEDTFGFFDTEPLERGGINFKVDSQYAKVYLDDVLVTIDNKIPR
jgi:hypothetical protein